MVGRIRSPTSRRCCLAFSGAIFWASTALSADAQTASQIVQPSYAPPTIQPQASVVIPEGAGSVTPPGSEALEVSLAEVVIDGVGFNPEELAALKARLTGRRLKVAEIFVAARELESNFAHSGHVLVRVIVPPQQLNDGATLRLKVVEGFIEAVDTSQVPENIRHQVALRLSPLVGAHHITIKAIERGLLLAADLPGVTLRSTLIAGQTEGATVLLVEVAQRQVERFVSLDNTLPSSLGGFAIGLGLNFNSVLSFGETIYFRASGLPNGGPDVGVLDSTPRNRALALGGILPVGADGLTFNLEATDARTAPRHEATLPGFASKFQRLSGRFSFPLSRNRALTTKADLAFDAQEERVQVIDPIVQPLSQDRLRIVRGAGALLATLPSGGTLSARAEGSLGIDVLGARSAADATALLPLSRVGSDANFQKATLALMLDTPLDRDLSVALSTRAQTSFGKPMANSEQIGIATSDGISPLPSGSIQGDAGYVVRGELRAQFMVDFQGGQARFSPYAFGAVGGVRLESPTFFERRDASAWAWGAGLRVSGGPRHDDRFGMSLSLEYGRARREGLAGTADRLSCTILTQF